jgi:hypothetical protein
MVTRKYLESRLLDLRAEIMDDLENHVVSIGSDMDILSKRITNCFEYTTSLMESHKGILHAKPAPKKPAKRRDPKKLNELIEKIRKA